MALVYRNFLEKSRQTGDLPQKGGEIRIEVLIVSESRWIMRKRFSGSAFARECPYSSGIHRRAAVFFAFCAVAFTLLYFRVGYLSRSPGLAQTARQQSKYTLAVSKTRGGIYDCRLRPLVNEEQEKVWAVLPSAENLTAVRKAVPVEFHGDKYAGTKRADADLNRVAVLVSAFQDGDRVVPVQFEIKESDGRPNKLYVSVTLRDIKTEPRVVGGGSNLSDSTAPPIRSSSYSISQLLEGVNPEDTDFLKYVPDGFLSWSQQAGKQRGILAEQEKLRKLRQESPVDTILNAGQGPAAENPAVDADAETKAVKTLLQPAKEPGDGEEAAGGYAGTADHCQQGWVDPGGYGGGAEDSRAETENERQKRRLQ